MLRAAGSIVRRILGDAHGSGSTYDKIAGPKEDDERGCCLIEGVYQLYCPDAPKLDIVFFTTRRRSPPWVTLDQQTHWPSVWLSDDLEEARILEAWHSGPERGLQNWEIAINVMNSLMGSSVGLGSRPYVLVSSGFSNIVVANTVMQSVMRNVLPKCAGIAMYGDVCDGDINENVRRVGMDYRAFERTAKTVTFLGTGARSAPVFCSSSEVHHVETARDEDLTRPTNKQSLNYGPLVSFIERCRPQRGGDGPAEDAAAAMLLLAHTI